MFYTIEPVKGGLIVVDGGWKENASFVREVLQKKGGVVDAWILTHPHPDHMGAFNSIYNNTGDITIKNIYTIDMDYESYKNLHYEWDGFDVYEEFLASAAGLGKQCHYVHTGDEIDLCGLSMKVLNAYSADETNAVSRDLCNDGSMMFKIYGREESMIFCADVGESMSDVILSRFEPEIKCDYIQMGHHGNGGLSEKFYRLTKPQAAFFDAPDWLMNPQDPESIWTTPLNRALMESMGANVYSFHTAPNQIWMK